MPVPPVAVAVNVVVPLLHRILPAEPPATTAAVGPPIFCEVVAKHPVPPLSVASLTETV